MKLRRIIKDYFSFNRGERSGVIVLIILIVIVFVAKQLVFYFEKPTLADRQQFEKALAERSLHGNPEKLVKHELFPFDPNEVDSITLSKFDLPQFVKNNLIKYRQHGGRFKRVSDFRKLYGMSDSVYAVIEPYLLIDSSFVMTFYANKVTPKVKSTKAEEVPDREVLFSQKSISINLNSASASELEKLKGIGPVLSERIVKYRELLGGYISVQQLKEVYGIKPEVFDVNRTFVFVDSVALRKLDLNFLSVDELAAHPYINYKEARRIVDFRTKNGYISDKNILLSDSIIGEERFRKLSYYLK